MTSDDLRRVLPIIYNSLQRECTIAMQAQQRTVSVGCTMLLGTEKKGILKSDADGYYTVVLGAYGAHNSQGMFYDLESARQFFSPGSALLRMIEKGVLRGEYKHPEYPIAVAGQSSQQRDQEYLQRVRRIDSDRVSHHIRKVYLQDGQVDDKGRPIVAVIGEIRPSGPYGKVIKDALDNPHENVYFSVRSLTLDDLYRGVKYTKEIITWDFVNEGGIYNANKYYSPALESFHEVEVTPMALWSLAEEQKRQTALGLESSAVDYEDLARQLGWEKLKPSKNTPIYTQW